MTLVAKQEEVFIFIHIDTYAYAYRPTYVYTYTYMTTAWTPSKAITNYNVSVNRTLFD